VPIDARTSARSRVLGGSMNWVASLANAPVVAAARARVAKTVFMKGLLEQRVQQRNSRLVLLGRRARANLTPNT
jgi:hypothetical protein